MASKHFSLWFGGIWLVVGLPFLVIGLYLGAQNIIVAKRLTTEGRTVEGLVLTKAIKSSSSKSSSSRNRSTVPSYHTTFRFGTPTGVFSGDAEVNVEIWNRLVERGPIRVTYLPDAPQSYRVEGQGSKLMLPVIFAVLGSVFSSIGGFIFVRGVGELRTKERLQREGVPVEGMVTDVRPSRFWLNGVQQWAFHYEFRDDRGRAYHGRRSMPPEEAEVWKTGDRGAVRYDRRRPQRSIWIGKT
jgi:hypothetical protein